MNNLSIIIYIADVIPKFGSFFAISATLSCLVMVISGIASLQKRSEFIYAERNDLHPLDEKKSLIWIFGLRSFGEH